MINYAVVTINATIKAIMPSNDTNPTATLSPTVPRVLLSLLFPGHTIFVFVIFAVEIKDLPSPAFLIFYLIAAVIQVCFCFSFQIKVKFYMLNSFKPF